MKRYEDKEDKTMKKNINKKGFTLIETVLVVAIITIVTGVTIVSIGDSYSRYQTAAEQARNREFPEVMLLTKERVLHASNNTRIQMALEGSAAGGYAHGEGGSGDADVIGGGSGSETEASSETAAPSATTAPSATSATTTTTTTTTTETTATSTTAATTETTAAPASGSTTYYSSQGTTSTYNNVSHGTHWDPNVQTQQSWGTQYGANVPDTTVTGTTSFGGTRVESFTVRVDGAVIEYNCNDWRYGITDNHDGTYTVTYTANQYQYNPPTSSVDLRFRVDGNNAPTVEVTQYTTYAG